MHFPSIVMFLFGIANGHMGISITAPKSVASRDTAVGDAFRYPNSGHCHGISPKAIQAEFAPGETLTLTLSNGAAHDGGHCALFLASRNTQPTERVWYKQMDDLDCTKKTSFDWTIDETLVPSECADGCTLIWAWTPKSSGACEIYMNCFDIKITNPGNNKASTVQIERELVCARVDSNKKTATYGQYCGPTCANTVGGGTEAPTAAPMGQGDTLPPTASPANPPRCGPSWIVANEQCLGYCQQDSDCSPNKCFADMIRLCESIPDPDTTPPIAPSTCFATPAWASSPGMDQWCASNCPASCPASHCTCGSKVQPLNPDQGVYNPVCQIVGSKDGDTLLTIAEQSDLAAQIPGSASVAEKTSQAAENLYTFNRDSGCNPNLENTTQDGVWPQLPVNTMVYLTGDCQLSMDCSNGDYSASRIGVHLVFLITIFGVMG